MLATSTSSATLFRSDSGIDCLSDDGVTIRTMKKWTSQESSLSIQSDSCNCDNTDEIDPSKTWKERLCPPRGWPAKWGTWLVVLGLIFGAIWSIVPGQMRPSDSLFGLVVTILLSVAAEQLVVKIPTPRGFPPLPPLLASLLMGLALRNIPVINIASNINEETSSILREMALTVILTRAGLEIEPEAMKKVKWAVVRLAFLPCIVETILIGILGHYIMGFPFEWSFMTGFMIAAVSPAVVIPSLIILQDFGFGVAKGVPSLVMAASGIDDVLAIAGFTVLLGIAIPVGLEDDIMSALPEKPPQNPLGTNNLAASNWSGVYTNATGSGMEWESSLLNSTSNPRIIQGSTDIGKEIGGAVIQVIIGIVSGLLIGRFISYVPPTSMRYKDFCRGLFLLSIGILFVFGSEVWGIPGSGALCALIMSFTASLHWKEEKKPLAEAWHYMWVVFQPVLFGLTGALVDVTLMDGETVGLGLAVLCVALIGRLITSTSVTFNLNLNLKERLFISIAWIPKGTVQAALGSAALEAAHRLGRPEQEIRWGEQILILSVLITLITAPVGGFGIALAGPRLLSASSGEGPNPKDNEAYLETESEERDHCSASFHSNGRRGSGVGGDHPTGLELVVKESGLEEIEEEEDGKAKYIEKDSTIS